MGELNGAVMDKLLCISIEDIDFLIGFILGIISIISFVAGRFAYKRNKISRKNIPVFLNVSQSIYKQGTNFYHIHFKFFLKNKTNKKFYIYSIKPVLYDIAQDFYLEKENGYKEFSPIPIEPYQQITIYGFIKSNIDVNAPSSFHIEIELHNKIFDLTIKNFQPNALIFPIIRVRKARKKPIKHKNNKKL